MHTCSCGLATAVSTSVRPLLVWLCLISPRGTKCDLGIASWISGGATWHGVRSGEHGGRVMVAVLLNREGRVTGCQDPSHWLSDAGCDNCCNSQKAVVSKRLNTGHSFTLPRAYHTKRRILHTHTMFYAILRTAFISLHTLQRHVFTTNVVCFLWRGVI